MRQILQNLRSGETEVVEVPVPQNRPGHLLIATRRSLVSAGTERMLVEFSKGSLVSKARQQPERVHQVLDKIQSDGILPTLDTVMHKLGQPLPLGYCNAGIVLEVGEGVQGITVGDRVVSNGPHAQIVRVPHNLCATIPDNVNDEEAAFAVLGAVALQGIRLAEPTLGERVAVIGLGLVGLLTVQLLVANGCKVLGADFDEERLTLATQFGAECVNLAKGEDPVAAGLRFTGGRGIDAVLVTAATSSNEPIHQAAEMSRKRGRIVLVGVTGLDLRRSDFYEKELHFQVSCSYGPGRYDPDYEQKGRDYPFGFVRWTAQRNFQAVLDLMAEGRLTVSPLISQRYPQEEAAEAYRCLTGSRSALGIILAYPEESSRTERTVTLSPSPNSVSRAATRVQIGVIGAGNFATGVLLPALSKTGVALRTIASASGTSAAVAARKFGFERATSDYRTILADDTVNCVLIATRHNSHAQMVVEALRAGKHVFVEKPLALTKEELHKLEEAVIKAEQHQLLVGFNRRFAPLAQTMRTLATARSGPLSLIYTVNAGFIPADHWTQDPKIGGGRIIGEACHFIDLLRFLTRSPIVGVSAQMIGENGATTVRQDKMTILLDFADGSTGAIHYLANGSKRFPKERLELFSEGGILSLDNFRTLKGYSWPGFRKQRSWRQDKGHSAEMSAFIERVGQGGPWLIPWHELREVTLASFTAVERAREREPRL